MEEKRKSIRGKADWVVSYKVYHSPDYVSGEFTGRFSINFLIQALRSRGINLPNGAGIIFINENILTDKKLYSRYPELSFTQEDKDIIARISSLNEFELRRFNRDIINRGDPYRSPKQSHNAALSIGSRIKNVSEIGLCILSRAYIPVESIIEMEIRADELPGPMKMWAQIVRSANINEDIFKFELGVVFIGMDYERWKVIHDHIERCIAKGEGPQTA